MKYTSVVWWLAAVMTAHSTDAQESSPASASTAPFTWKRAVHLHDGRTFISDGAIALHAALVKPASAAGQNLPEASADLVERYLAASLPEEVSVSQLKVDGDSRKYIAPNGVILNAVYIDYLRRTLPESHLRLRMKSDLEPVVIVLDGKAVGLLMPMRR